MSFIAKVIYYGTLVMPFYKFLRDVVKTGYAQYINHREELEQAKMMAEFEKNQLEELSIDEFFRTQEQMRKKGEKYV